MKIGIYKDTLAKHRGADVAVQQLADGLVERGHEVTLFEKSDFAAKVHGGYDVIVSAGTNEIMDLAEVKNLPPIVQQFHTDPDYPFRHWIKRWRRNYAIKAALQKVAAIQILQERHRETLVRQHIHPPRVEVIGNWSKYSIRPLALPYPSSPYIILCPGALNKDKNQKLLIEAFRLIASDFPNWEVHLYGEGRPTFEPHPQVKIMGFADLEKPYVDCAFVAFPSMTEGFGLVIADAAAFGKPTLCIRDWIGCGVVVNGTVEDYANGLRRLMGDADYRRQEGALCRDYCATYYSRERILDQWEALLSSIAGTSSFKASTPTPTGLQGRGGRPIF